MNDLHERPLHGVAIYNPRLLSKEELIGFFVARQVELERITEALRREAKAQPQHHLVVGARGMGKTTLLHRLRYAIEDDEELASRCIGLVFPEEQYNVVCLADFWLNCVDALADGLESSGRTGLLEGLDEEIERVQALPSKDDRGRRALELLCQLSDRLGRRLVLLVDNVDLVLDRLEDEQWALREVLSSGTRIQLIGATSAPLESQYRHDKAFYDFFRVHHLDGLDDEATFTVLRRLAEMTGHDRVARLLDEESGRVKTVRLMAGGNPRTVVLLFSVLAQGTDGDVRTDIERILDQCTPLYKHRLEALPMQAQQVLDALAKHWAPATATVIADATHLRVNVVSAQLDRLVRDGTVEKVSFPDTKRQGFQIAERFFNIWCLMRASRRVRTRLVWLVEFLRLMFGAEELAKRARLHLAVTWPRDGSRHAELGLALADVVENTPLRAALETQSLRVLCSDPTLRRMLPELLDLQAGDRHLIGRAERLRLLAEAHDAVMSTRADSSDWEPEAGWEALASAPWLTLQDKHDSALSERGRPEPMKTLAVLLANGHRRFSGMFVPEEVGILARAVRDGDIDTYNPQRDELEAAALVHGHRSLIACALGVAARNGVQVDFDWLTSEVKHSRSLLPWLAWAEIAYARGIDPASTSSAVSAIADASDWGPLGLVLLGDFWRGQLRRYDAAEHAYRKAIELDSQSIDGAWLGLARTLYLKRQNLEEAALAAKRELGLGMFMTFNSFLAPFVLATISVALGDWPQAEHMVRRFIEGPPKRIQDEYWSVILEFFSEAVQRGFCAQARELLASAGINERWEPLDHALEVLEDGDLTRLDRLAPEMREAVRLVLARISPRTLEEGTPHSKRHRPTTKRS